MENLVPGEKGDKQDNQVHKEDKDSVAHQVQMEVQARMVPQGPEENQDKLVLLDVLAQEAYQVFRAQLVKGAEMVSRDSQEHLVKMVHLENVDNLGLKEDQENKEKEAVLGHKGQQDKPVKEESQV